MNIMFGCSNFYKKQLPIDITIREFILFMSMSILIFWLGFVLQTVIV